MKASWKNAVLAVLAGVVTASLIMYCSSPPKVRADEGKAAGPGRYTVVMTEGHNLLVADNGSNNLYFYTIDKDKPIGSPLKLRASIDLTKVGQPEIEITKHNLESK
jgi:hypothetical protein